MKILVLLSILFFGVNVNLLAAKGTKKEVTIVHKAIDKAVVGTPLKIDVELKNAQNVKFVILYHCPFVTQEWEISEMKKVAEDKYSYELLSNNIVKDGVVYYIDVVDESGKIIKKFASRNSPQYIDTYIDDNINTKNKIIEVETVITDKIPISLEDELEMFATTDVKVVTASKKVQYLSDAPAIVSVIGKKNIENSGALYLIDVLKQVPGLEVSMGINGDYRVAIRGVRKDGNILVLLNGHRINDFYDAKAIYDLPVDLIGRIEIIRGPGSSLFGTNAIAGIINIFTIEDYNYAKVTGGLNNTYQSSMSYTIENQKFKTTISAGYSQTDGNNAIIKEDNGSLGDKEWSLAFGNKEFETQRWNKYAYATTKIESGNFKFFIFGNEKKQGTWAGPLFVAAPDSEYKSNQILVDMSYNKKISEKVSIVPKIYGDILNHDYLIQETPDGYFSSISKNTFQDGRLVKEEYNNITFGTDIQINYDVLENLDIIGGFNFEYLYMQNYDINRNYKISTEEVYPVFGKYDETTLTQNEKYRNVFATYFQTDYKLENFGFTAGFRFDYYSDFGSSFNPRAGVIYKPADFINFKILYGQAFRAPTFKELYDSTNKGDDGVLGSEVNGNKLKPETVRSFEFGTQLDFWKIILRGNIFYNTTDNMIYAFDEQGAGNYGFYANIGLIKSYGFESEFIFNLNKYFGLFFNASYIESKFEWNKEIFDKTTAPDLAEKDKILYNFPNVRINSGFNVNFYKFETFFALNYGNNSLNNHRLVIERLHPVDIPSYLLFDFAITYNHNKNFKVILSGKNIGNQKYSDPDDSNLIDTFDRKGLVQPTAEYNLNVVYRF